MEDSDLRRFAREAFQQMAEETRHLSLEQIAELVSGETSGAGRAEMEKHIAECELCRERLDDFKLFQSECESPAPQELTQEWRELRRRIRWRKAVVAAPRWGAIAAGIVVVAALSWLIVKWLAPESAERLLAQAYKERRITEFRLAGAGYAPMRSQERAGGSAFSLPAPLLKATAKLEEQLKSNPDDPGLLRLRGEAEMMEREAGAAVQTLHKALDLRSAAGIHSGDDPRILADLGIAYALRGDMERQFGDYTNALEYLTHSLQLRPKVAEVVFNRALVFERMMLKDRAIEEWGNYLKLDGIGDWAKEARKHMSDLKSQMKAREDVLHEIVEDPVKFLAVAGSGRYVDAEAYLRDFAVTRWLPRALSGESYKKAVFVLADILKRRGDPWLFDAVAPGLTVDLISGFERVALADEQMNTGDTATALATVRQAEEYFRRAGSRPARFRAGLSEVSILKNSLEGNAEALAAAGPLLRELESSPYIWLRARLQIEYGVCLARSGNLYDAGVLLREAIRIGQAAGFGDTTLRAHHMYLGTIGQHDVPSEVFASAEQALRDFWAGAYPPSQYHAIVDELRAMASGSGRIYAAWMLARSEVWAIKAASSPMAEAPARENLAALAQAVGETGEARENLAISERIYKQIPDGYGLGPATALATAELQRGEIDAALTRLVKARGKRELEPNITSVAFYAAVGEAYRRKGLFHESVAAFQKSIADGKIRLSSIAREPEKAGLLKIMANSYRGLVAVTLARPDGAEKALRLWQDFRTLDAANVRGPGQAQAQPIIWFVELPDGYAAWLERDGRVAPYRVAAAKSTIEATVSRLLRECSDPSGSSRLLLEDSQQLYAWIIEPAAAQLTPEDRQLILELDGALTAVPVQALMVRDGRYLMDQFSILVSAGVGALPQLVAPGSGAKILVMANPAITGTSASRFPSLPDSLRESDLIRVFFGGTFLSGRDASIDALLTALPSADIVHFAGHGYANSGNGALLFAPRNSNTADYDLLTAAALRRQNWSRCRLAVLSACATAAGETRGAHNPDSLVRAFIKAGTQRVVASLWNVDSAATAELMREFYASLAKGEIPDRALGAAQRIVRQKQGWEHPYFWAGFQLYGTT